MFQVCFQWYSSGLPVVIQCVPIMQINTGLKLTRWNKPQMVPNQSCSMPFYSADTDQGWGLQKFRSLTSREIKFSIFNYLNHIMIWQEYLSNFRETQLFLTPMSGLRDFTWYSSATNYMISFATRYFNKLNWLMISQLEPEVDWPSTKPWWIRTNCSYCLVFMLIM